MANTYTQIHLQFVFAVKYRDGLIHSSFKEELYQYISGIIKAINLKNQPLMECQTTFIF